ncbi:AsmA family protein [Parvibaculum sp.]|uniref:AsmA family protein n=1 Tax=Parvibaculum sp. TaxID=2024848 RepID=UPI00320FEB25
MSRLIAIIVGIVVLLAAVIVAVPMLVPADVYKQRIVSLVKAQTGRDLSIGGNVGFSFFPRLAVKVENVSISNAPWAKDRDMASMREMRAALKVIPLFKGDVQIDSFALVDPVIHLEVKADGTPNWQFASAGSTPARTTPTTAPQGTGAPALRQLSLGDVSIENGTATYRNQKTGASLAFEKVNLDLALPSLDDPFTANGSLVWNNEALSLKLKANRPRALTEGGETPVELALKSSKINSTFNGAIRPFEGLKFAGNVTLDVASVRNLAAWLGNALPAGNGFGPLSIEGKASGGDGIYNFSDAKIGFDGMNATGSLAVNASGKRPFVKGRLAVDRIDANTYLASDGAASGGGGNGGGDAGWSNDPIDLSGLRAADADFTFSTHELLIKQIKIGESALALRLNNGVMNVDLTKLALYEGAGSGKLTLDGSQRVPQAAASFSIAGVSAAPLLTDAADFKRLDGKTALNFAVQTVGQSQRQMVGNLGGKGEVKFTNGAIKGVNVAQLIRNVGQGALTGWNSGGSQDTDFSELGGTFTIDKGILTNNDLKMLSPLVRLSGNGTADLPNRSLSYHINPKLAATLEGQGGSADAKGLEIPLIIEGPWSAPKFRPDLEAMLKNPNATIDQIKNLKGGGGKEMLKGLLGGGAKTETPSGTGTTGTTGTTTGTGATGTDTTGTGPTGTGSPTQEQPKPADQLKKLFGG